METEGKITIYTSSLCPVCSLVRDFFTIQNIDFTEINVDLRPLERMKLIAGSKRLRVPQTNIDGTWISGFHPEKFLHLIYD